MFVYESLTVNIWKMKPIRASVIRANKVLQSGKEFTVLCLSPLDNLNGNHGIA